MWIGAILASYITWYQGLALTLGAYALLRRFSFTSVLLFALLAGGAIYGVHASTLDQSAIAKLARQGTEVSVRAVITSEPKETAPKVRGSRLHGNKMSFLARTSMVASGDRSIRVRVPIRVLAQIGSIHLIGEEIEVPGSLITTVEKRVAATLITSREIKIVTSPGLISKSLTKIRWSFRDQLSKFGDDAGALIPGMIIGDTSLQSSMFTEHMRRAGLSHLTAVSGANFAIVSSLVFVISRRVVARIIPRLLLTSTFLMLFLLLVRPSPSVLRAGVMAGVILVARASGNIRNSVTALGAAISLLLLVDPFQANDPGFILSVLATSGLIFIAPILTAKLIRHLPESVAETIAVPCAATIACTPYLLVLAGEISTLSIVFNILVAPFVAPVTILGFLSLLAMPIRALSNFLIWPAHFCAQWITTVARWSDFSPSIAINFWVLLGFIGFSLALLTRKAHKSLVVLTLIAVIILLAPRASFPGSNWKIVQCDVGQGDALVFNLGGGSGILFDAGPEPRLLNRCLRTVGIKRLPLVVISHGHADHYFGAEGLSTRFEIGEVWSNGNIIVDKLFGFETKVVKQGMKASINNLQVEILWPDNRGATFQSLSGDGSAENNRSVVVLVTWSGRKILITGDIEPEVQANLSRQYDLNSVDVLKVPHHGSRFQDVGFLSEISPEIALVSVGLGNSYGHPSAELIASLAKAGSRIFRTDQDGPISVAWRFDDSASRYIFTTRTMRKEWWRVQWR